MKRAVSPLIATVLMITLTVAAAVIVYTWAHGLVKEQIEKFGKNAEQVCDQLNFNADVRLVSANLFDLYLINQGNVPIYAVDITKIGKSKSVVDRRVITLSEGSSTKQTLTLERSSYSSILVLPVILGSVRGQQNEKPYACTQQYGQKLDLPL